MTRFEIRRRRDERGAEYGAFLIFADGEPIGSPSGTLTAELVRQANAAADMLAELRWITRCASIRMPYGGKAYAIRDETMERAKALVKQWEDA